MILVAVFVMGANSSKPYANNEKNSPIEEVEREDVTGDGRIDTISIKESIVKESNNEVVKEILQLDIAGEKQPVTIPLSAGDPWLLLTDLNNDGVKDVFVTIRSREKEDKVKVYSYTFKNKEKKDLSIPPIVQTTGRLLDDYKAELKVLNHVHLIDLRASKRALEQSKVYRSGQLLKSTDLTISDYVQLKPIITKTGKGIRGVQRVKGPIPNKIVGELISVWYYREGKWMLQDIDYSSNYKKVYHYIDLSG